MKFSSASALPLTEAIRRLPVEKHEDVKCLIEPQSPTQEAAATRVNEMWSAFRRYADAEFVREFCTQPYARYWEMFIAKALLDCGREIRAPKPGPDLSLIENGTTIWIEAIAASPGNTQDAVPSAKLGSATYVPEDSITMRFTAALDEKRKKFARYLENKIITAADPCIVAISTQGLPLYPTLEPLLRALFPIGPLTLSVAFDKSGIERSSDVYYPRRDRIWKQNGKPISTKAFASPDLQLISGVLQARPLFIPSRTLSSYITLIHNPFALNPIAKGSISVGLEIFARVAGDAMDFYYLNADGVDAPLHL